jgi:hypothetical protein
MWLSGQVLPSVHKALGSIPRYMFYIQFVKAKQLGKYLGENAL